EEADEAVVVANSEDDNKVKEAAATTSKVRHADVFLRGWQAFIVAFFSATGSLLSGLAAVFVTSTSTGSVLSLVATFVNAITAALNSLFRHLSQEKRRAVQETLRPLLREAARHVQDEINGRLLLQAITKRSQQDLQEFREFIEGSTNELPVSVATSQAQLHALAEKTLPVFLNTRLKDALVGLGVLGRGDSETASPMVNSILVNSIVDRALLAAKEMKARQHKEEKAHQLAVDALLGDASRHLASFQTDIQAQREEELKRLRESIAKFENEILSQKLKEASDTLKAELETQLKQVVGEARDAATKYSDFVKEAKKQINEAISLVQEELQDIKDLKVTAIKNP
ncbi:MAG TPA: hypothetical protein VEF04_05985, partial [Blastocatellia bacterium]|nr:hypothetical protein [Blastocatellia bacterium]